MGSDRTGANKIKRPWLAEWVWWGFKFVFKVLSHVEVLGQENMPRDGAVLLVINHLSYADPPLIYATMPRHEDVVVMVADTYQKIPFYRWIIESVNSVWINRGAGDRAALRASMEALRHNNILGMAPEGTRSKTGLLQQGKTGAAFMASKLGVKIVPVGMIGTAHTFTELKRFRRPRLVAKYGEAFSLPPLEGANKSVLLDDYTHEIMCRLAALLPDEYHGFYQGDKRIEEIRRLTK